MSKSSVIKLMIELNENKLPDKISWEASDSEFEGMKEAKSILLSLWDKNENITYSIDLWTKDMLVNEMDTHFYQVFMKLADTYNRATNNSDVSLMIENFGEEFAKKTDINKKQ